MQNTESTARQSAELRKLGVAISMDDFGTGYSSLGYLWQFRFDKLKIDQSFISALNHNEKKAREILDTIIMLGHKLEMTVTAEGIETAHQAEVLVGAGVRPCAGLSLWPPGTGQRNSAVPAGEHAHAPGPQGRLQRKANDKPAAASA